MRSGKTLYKGTPKAAGLSCNSGIGDSNVFSNFTIAALAATKNKGFKIQIRVLSLSHDE
jgi:hypothetical protein